MESIEFKELMSGDLEETLASELKSVIIFTASWCGPCKVVKPKLPTIASAYGVKAFWVDAEKNVELAARYNVQAVPFIATFREGKIVESFATNNLQKIEEMISRV